MPSRAGTAQTHGGACPRALAIVRLIIGTTGKGSSQHGWVTMSRYGAGWLSGPWACDLAYESSPSQERPLQDLLECDQVVAERPCPEVTLRKAERRLQDYGLNQVAEVRRRSKEASALTPAGSSTTLPPMHSRPHASEAVRWCQLRFGGSGAISVARA
jgi:hypothetical protein